MEINKHYLVIFLLPSMMTQDLEFEDKKNIFISQIESVSTSPQSQ